MMLAHNMAMKRYLATQGIKAMPWRIDNGSQRGTWRLYDRKTKWWDNFKLQGKLTALGFKDYDGDVLDQFSGNGGQFAVFVIAPKSLGLER